MYSDSTCTSANELTSTTTDADFRTLSGPTLRADLVTGTGARLTIRNHTGAWWYKGAQSGATCTSVTSGTTRVTLTGLSTGRSYTYKAYSNSACTTELTTNATDAEFVASDSLDVRVGLSAPAPAPGCVASALYGACVAEGGTLTLTATLERALERDVTVPVLLERKDAERGDVGYVSVVYIRIPAGSMSGTADVRTYADADDAHEHFWLKLNALGGPDLPDGLALNDDHTVHVTIYDGVGGGSNPAAAATATLTVTPSPVSEGSPVTVTATLSKALAEAVSIPLTVTRGTSEESDHGTLASIDIAAGETTGSDGIATYQDLDGDDETFTVALDTDSLPSSVAAGDPASATVTIDDTVTGETITPVLFPNPPAIVEATPGDGQVTLSWSGVAGAMGWEVERDGSGTWTATGSDATGHTVTGLDNGTSYSFKVRATGLLPALKGNASASVSATPTPAPDPVGAITVTHNGSSLTVTWDAPARATHYDVTYTNTGNGETGRAALNRAGTSLTITCDIRAGYENQHCIDAAATYTVGVRARNAAGESAWANSASVSPPAPVQPATAPDPVGAIGVTHKGSSLEVTWDAPAGATHYDVTYSGNGAHARAAWTGRAPA